MIWALLYLAGVFTWAMFAAWRKVRRGEARWRWSR